MKQLFGNLLNVLRNCCNSCQGLNWRLWEACLQPFKGFHHRPHDYWFWFLWQLSWTISWLIFYKLEYRIVEKKYVGQNMISGPILHCKKKSYFLKTKKAVCRWNDIVRLIMSFFSRYNHSFLQYSWNKGLHQFMQVWIWDEIRGMFLQCVLTHSPNFAVGLILHWLGGQFYMSVSV